MTGHEDHGGIAAAEHGIARSSHWPALRDQVAKHQLDAWRSKFKDFDERYEGVEWEVHHRIAFHFGALLGLGYIELDPRNLIVIPRHPVDLHLLLGHLDDFRSFNTQVTGMLWTFGGELWGGKGSWDSKTESAIKSNPDWLRAHLGRPRVWAEMSVHDKAAIAHMIRTELPLVHPSAA